MADLVHKKMVIVGDGACGKTCLLIMIAQGKFLTDKYVPTVFENYATVQTIDGKQVSVITSKLSLPPTPKMNFFNLSSGMNIFRSNLHFGTRPGKKTTTTYGHFPTQMPM